MGDTGAYERLRKIGAGGMGEVWLARRALGNGIEKTVALKFLPSHVAEDARARRDFIREVQLCMHLSHAAIVQVFDVCEVEGRLCMVMEWVDGVDLAQLMRARAREGRALPVEVVTHIIIELLRALDYAHRLQHDGRALCIVHRDVSPHNVLVSVSGDVKLTDFGVARPVHEETSGLHVRGKLRYMAPEQFQGGVRSPSLDLYAAGAVLHELLSGTRFRDAPDDAALYRMILEGEVPPCVRADVPPALEHLRCTLLSRDPEARPTSARAAIASLVDVPRSPEASEQLAEICREILGVQGPRSGVYPSLEPTPAREGSGSVEVEGGTRTASLSNLDSSKAVPTASRAKTAARTGLGTLALASLGGLALAWGGWWPGDATPVGDAAMDAPSAEVRAPSQPADARPAEDPVAATEAATLARVGSEDMAAAIVADDAPPDDVTMQARAELEGHRAGAPASDAGKEAAGASSPASTRGERDDAGIEEPPARAPDKPPVKTARVKVTFRASDYDFAYLRVAGRTLTLEPSTTVSLPVGRHQVSMRSDPNARWTPVGRIRLSAGAPYDARLRKPGRIDLQRR